MAGANSNFQLLGTDFNQIKSNLLTYFKDQEVLKDANYTGSVLSMLMDVLAYNTHYNAFYLNMVSNEMFLDTATRRSSVVSHAKVLGYYPNSRSCPTAIVEININNLESTSFLMPRYTKFLSEKIDDRNYTFVTTREYFTKPDSLGNIKLENVVLKQGEPVVYYYTYDAKTNPNSIFKLPESNIDIDTIEVVVQNSITDIYTSVYNKIEDPLTLDNTSEVFFVQESLDGLYEIYFGNGVLGKKLNDGNVIGISYLVTDGNEANDAKEFYLIDQLATYESFNVTTISSASQGSNKETIDSIKTIAPKYFSSQGRAVTVNDYITLIKRQTNKFPIESVNVWDGTENDPPVYGKVFIAVKPFGAYTITENQKRYFSESVIKPLSLVTVEPEIVDVDYTFLNLNINVLVDFSKTFLTDNELRSLIITEVQDFANKNLNTFESSLIIPDLLTTINNVDQSIITNEDEIKLQKRIFPTLGIKNTYIADFGVPIKKGVFGESVSIFPSVKYKTSTGILLPEVYLEEYSVLETRIREIEIINRGYGYTSVPSVIIDGDGTGATAHAIISNGRLSSIVIDNPGQGYTQAKVTISGGGGSLGSGKIILEGQFGILRTYYYNNSGIKTILNTNAGTVDYVNGIISLIDFGPEEINNSTGILNINVVPDSTIIYSVKDKLLTLDVDDPTAIVVNFLAK